MLVTSRTALHLSGEREFGVSPLPLPDLARLPPPDELVRVPSVALFVERAQAVAPRFALTAENAAAVAGICARLDGLPLAIELAAARVKLLSPAALAARLDHCLQVLTGGPKDVPTRQQTLRATIDWSHQVLSPAEQRLFRRLAVFAAPCTIEAAEAVCDSRQDLGMDVLEGMASVVDQSLLRRSEGARWRAPVRDAGDDPRVRARAARGGGRGARHAPGARRLLAGAGRGRRAGDRRARAARPGWRASTWSWTTCGPPWTTSIAAGQRGMGDAAGHRAPALLAPARAAGRGPRAAHGGARRWPGARPHTRAQALYAASLLTGEQGDGPTTRALLTESVALYRELGDERATLVALNALAVACQLMGDLAAARTHLETVLREARRGGDADNVARCLNNLGSVAHATGDLAEARRLYEECRAVFEAARGPRRARPGRSTRAATWRATPATSAEAGRALWR